MHIYIAYNIYHNINIPTGSHFPDGYSVKQGNRNKLMIQLF